MAAKDRERESSSRQAALFIGLALLLHVAGLPAIVQHFARPVTAESKPLATRRVDMISLTTPRQPPSKIKREPPPAAAERPAVTPPKVAQDTKPVPPRGQVVDLPPSPDNRPPDKADYLSEHNTRTARETRSRHQSPDYENAMNEPSVADRAHAATPRPNPQATALQLGPDKPERDKPKADANPAQGAREIPTIKQRDRLALRFDETLGEFRNQERSSGVEGNSDRLKVAPGAQADAASEPGSAPKEGLTMADLVPKVGVLARLDGGPANDDLSHVEEGEGTFLNSREFKYASFFNRLKRGVSQHWRPLAEYQRRDPTGNIYGYRSRVTVLSITLKADGSLAGVEVKQSSGVEFLDQEAVSAFRRAEPFPNPPRGLADPSGMIVFPFGFHIDFSHHGGSLESPY